MKNRSAARKYAKVLIRMTSSREELDRQEAGIRAVLRIMESSGKVRKFFMTPMAGKKRKWAVLEEIGRRTGLSPQLLRFFSVLVENERLHLLAEIVQALKEMRDEKENAMSVEVVSAMELNDDSREKIRAIFSSMTGKKVRLDVRVDRSIIGGIVTKVGSHIYDGGVRGQLMRMKERILGD